MDDRLADGQSELGAENINELQRFADFALYEVLFVHLEADFSDFQKIHDLHKSVHHCLYQHPCVQSPRVVVI